MSNLAIKLDAEQRPQSAPAAFTDDRFSEVSESYYTAALRLKDAHLLEFAEYVLPRANDPELEKLARAWIATLKHRLKT